MSYVKLAAEPALTGCRARRRCPPSPEKLSRRKKDRPPGSRSPAAQEAAGSNEGKRKIVLFADADWRGWSDRAIAKGDGSA